MNSVFRSAAFALVCFGALGSYVALRRSGQVHNTSSAESAVAAPRGSSPLVGSLGNAPYIVYRSARPGEFGRLVAAPFDGAQMMETRRIVTTLSCERGHFDRRGGVCLTYDRDALEPNFRALLVDAEFSVYQSLHVAGYPSRTSLSPDGRFGATTVFTTGDSYDGQFTTRTTIIDRRTGTALPDLEQFPVTRDGEPFKRVDFNFWGVTFEPTSDNFYVTLSTEGHTYLVRGSVERRALEIVLVSLAVDSARGKTSGAAPAAVAVASEHRSAVALEGVECPSLSPDAKHIAFKRRSADGAVTQLYVLSTESWQMRALPGETRHVDDQAAWLDEAHVLYGVTTAGAPSEALGVWVASIRPGDPPPRLLIAGASSPSVVR